MPAVRIAQGNTHSFLLLELSRRLITMPIVQSYRVSNLPEFEGTSAPAPAPAPVSAGQNNNTAARFSIIVTTSGNIFENI